MKPLPMWPNSNTLINNKIPIIVTSAFNEQDYLLEAINLGVTRYILKPFNRTILREIVEDTINYVNLTLNEKIHTAEIEAIYDNIKDGIVLLDKDLKFTKFNHAFTNIVGFNKNELTDKDFISFIDKSQKEKILDILKNKITHESVENMEFKLISKSLTLKDIYLSALILPLNETIFITIKDMTKIKNNESVIRNYSNLIDEYIIISKTDLEGNITYVSKALCNATGYKEEELIGQNHRILKYEDMKKELFEDLWETIINNKEWIGEIKNKKKNGDSYWVKSKIAPLFKNDKKIGYLSIRQDITDKKTFFLFRK